MHVQVRSVVLFACKESKGVRNILGVDTSSVVTDTSYPARCPLPNYDESRSTPSQEPVGGGRDAAGKSAISTEQATVALISLAIADREDRLKLVVANQTGKTPIRRSEAILADVGLSFGQIAAITGKPYKVVEGLVRRNRVCPAPW